MQTQYQKFKFSKYQNIREVWDVWQPHLVQARKERQADASASLEEKLRKAEKQNHKKDCCFVDFVDPFLVSKEKERKKKHTVTGNEGGWASQCVYGTLPKQRATGIPVTFQGSEYRYIAALTLLTLMSADFSGHVHANARFVERAPFKTHE